MIFPLALLALHSVNAGVPGLTKYFKLEYKSAWTHANPTSPIHVDHLCIDMNHFLHNSFRKSTTMKHFMSKLFSVLDEILMLAMPTQSLVLAFDGWFEINMRH